MKHQHACIRQHTSAFVSIRQQTSAYVNMPGDLLPLVALDLLEAATTFFSTAFGTRFAAARTPAYISIRQLHHMSAYVSIRQHQHTSAYVSIRQHTSASAYFSIRQQSHTSAYVSIRQHQHTSAYVSIRLFDCFCRPRAVLALSSTSVFVLFKASKLSTCYCAPSPPAGVSICNFVQVKQVN